MEGRTQQGVQYAIVDEYDEAFHSSFTIPSAFESSFLTRKLCSPTEPERSLANLVRTADPSPPVVEEEEDVVAQPTTKDVVIPTSQGQHPQPLQNATKISAETVNALGCLSEGVVQPQLQYHPRAVGLQTKPESFAQNNIALPQTEETCTTHASPPQSKAKDTPRDNAPSSVSEDGQQKFLWQREQPCDDPMDERKRVNARKARRNRLKQKEKKEQIQGELFRALEELKALKKKVEEDQCKHASETDKLIAENKVLRETIEIILSQCVNNGLVPVVTVDNCP